LAKLANRGVEEISERYNAVQQPPLRKAGITGWAQVSGWPGDASIQKRLENDLYYLQNWSFSFDLPVIA